MTIRLSLFCSTLRLPERKHDMSDARARIAELERAEVERELRWPKPD